MKAGRNKNQDKEKSSHIFINFNIIVFINPWRTAVDFIQLEGGQSFSKWLCIKVLNPHLYLELKFIFGRNLS
jgi:hypothetical protein